MTAEIEIWDTALRETWLDFIDHPHSIPGLALWTAMTQWPSMLEIEESTLQSRFCLMTNKEKAASVHAEYQNEVHNTLEVMGVTRTNGVVYERAQNILSEYLSMMIDG